ncbi:hypothetical protein PIB30_043994 [Stylosanthes scabra]|uniref:Exostosin GT47 domain-containing protein n=1 Tax=Stylosanthes scabra TaxID=79078 RepID=A0ABU6UIZ7_9FABA|nr:hypothetical protein [Stylosanthes scabra]
MVVIVLMVQYFELPYSEFVTSLAGKITSFSMDASMVNSKLEGNIGNTHPNGSTLAPLDQDTSSVTHNNGNGSIINNAPSSLEKPKEIDTVVFRDSSNLTSQGASSTSNRAPAPQIMVALSNQTSLINSETDSTSPMKSVVSNSTLARKGTTKDENSGSGNGNGKYVITKNPKGKPSKVVSISDMNLLLKQGHDSSQLVEIFNARSEIENAPIITNDSRLYQPLYRNVSMFKRSYELMEKMLKVYIYKDGERPIFHEPLLDGIYASEGWFMKLMEENKHFVTQDPESAHLFYIPFSSRLLQLTIYVRNSHNRSNLIQYMAKYVDMIAGKYPFWSRTNGADHFVVACHDWAPAETRGRILNCIRALCNADIEVGFKIGKDVSLPETYIRSPNNPAKNIGGNPPSQRPILAFFAGGLHGYVRPILLNHWEDKEPDMKISGPLPHVKGNANYIELMKSSKFCICARGHEVNSPRVVEAIFHECVPVIIADNFIPPLFEVLNWESFAVLVPEKDIPNLRSILLSISEERYLEMHKRVKKVQEHFVWHYEPVKYDLFHMLLHSIWYNRIFRISHT